VTGAIPIRPRPVVDPEDAARAEWYALLARLFYAPADAPLLAALGEIVVPHDDEAATAPFAQALRGLAAAARAADPAGVREEYDALFIGTGKSRVTLYVTHYLVQTGREKLLVRLRDDLSRHGLARKEGALEPEDHLAGICEALRHLITTGGSGTAPAQRDIFDRYLAGSREALCDAIAEAAPAGGFHAALGAFARAFLAVEAEAFGMDA